MGDGKIASYMLDVETEGLNPEEHKIITIQYQKLHFKTGQPIDDLVILKAWESSEKDILEKFQKVFGTEQWGFVATGFNMHFENKFLYERSIACGLDKPIELFSRPTLDLHPVGILLNNGLFKGSGLNKITGKEGNGLTCLTHYQNGEYDKVIAYIKQEAREYLKFYVWLRKRMPSLLDEFTIDCL